MQMPSVRVRPQAFIWIAALLMLAMTPVFAYTTLAPKPGEDGKPKRVEVRFGIEIGAGSGNVHFSGARNGAAVMTAIDYSSDFDAGTLVSHVIPSWQVVLGGRYRLETSALISFGRGNTAMLNRALTWQNTTFAAGNRVRANDNFFAWNFDFLYGVIEDSRNGSLRVGGGFVVQGARNSLKDITAAGPEISKSLTVILPQLVAEGEIVLDDRWARLFARAELAGLDTGYNAGATAGIRMRTDEYFEFSFHLRAYTAGIMDKDSYNHYNDFVGGGLQFLFKL